MLPNKKLILRYDITLCDGRHCPAEKRDTCYRYMLHHFFDVVATNNIDKEVFWFVEPTPVNGKCPMYLRPQYQDKER